MYGQLTSDVPLGPFEGTTITVWSGQGKQAKLHATPSCSYLRSARGVERTVHLDAAVVGRMCPQCGTYGSWARPGTGLAVFLDTLTGLGLLYELDSFRDPDEDAFEDEEVRHAAAVLYKPVADTPAVPGEQDDAEDDEDDTWEERQEAQRVRESVLRQWGGALASMHRTHRQLALFPWLRAWAGAALEAKAGYLRVLQEQAQLLVAERALLAATAAAAMTEPDVPADEPAFAPLGDPGEARRQLLSLWRRWRSAVEDSWDDPQQQTYVVHHLTDTMGSRRKGRDQMLERARAVVAGWEADVRAAAGERHGDRVVVARLPHDAAERGSGRSLVDRLGEWELGVLASYTADVVWEPQSVITVRVPEPVAVRLLTQHHTLSYSEPETDEADQPAAQSPADPRSATGSGVGPGVFDDTPVHSRHLVTGEHLRALRATMRDAEQLYVVFSVGGGLEVVALSVLEERCAAGWQGSIIAGASDLPDALFAPRQPSPGQEEPVWPARIHDPHHEAFGSHLSTAEGERVLVRLREGRRDTDHALRSLALARGVADLRQLQAVGYDDRDFPRRPFASAVWHGLLAMEQLDLEPFEPDTDTGWQRGSGLPLGVLAGVQAYTSDAEGRYQGRAHSPDCKHRRPEHGVSRDDDLVTIAELLGNKGFDPCSKCGGYAVRRLSQDQVAYYRAAHRLHSLTHQVHSAAARNNGTGSAELAAQLREFAELDRRTANAWFPLRKEARQWRQTVNALLGELPGPA
ncbi:hypothetical protein ADL01_23630 [Streptomyces sp. NRRL WC-3618]|uniref:Uncharacterized protein n=1 Tax=Streptomyces humidus TaxID=52259 RepID=A0A918FTN7_9ACTN|nr:MULTISPECIES: hypothetical protein [Streptomyces]KOV67996.1 hypothetical protein ADL01_23630 [Streptomyces sp. NRRL WC-3618]MCX5294082.1 hypothetical protein [Streptomyces sp. NBC_00183]GGR82572.1 hypothetical protein GCM10010269_22220 [Streptomyces humidus]